MGGCWGDEGGGEGEVVGGGARRGRGGNRRRDEGGEGDGAGGETKEGHEAGGEESRWGRGVDARLMARVTASLVTCLIYLTPKDENKRETRHPLSPSLLPFMVCKMKKNI